MTTHQKSLVVALVAFGLPLAGGCSPQAPKQQAQSAEAEKTSSLKLDGEVFQLWCDKAGETDVATGNLSEYYERFCDGGKPTDLFKSRLIGKAYEGEGKPRVTPLNSEVFESDNKTTSVLAGVALKLPVDSVTQFDKVSPLQGDAERAKKLGSSMFKAESLDINVKKTHKARGSGHVRGWDIETVATNSKPVPMTVQYTARNDQYEFEKGKAYQYATYMIDGEKKTVQEQVMYSAMIETEEGTFIVSQIYIKTGNLGKPSIAEATLKNALIDGAAGIWNVSNKFAGDSEAE